MKFKQLWDKNQWNQNLSSIVHVHVLCSILYSDKSKEMVRDVQPVGPQSHSGGGISCANAGVFYLRIKQDSCFCLFCSSVFWWRLQISVLCLRSLVQSDWVQGGRNQRWGLLACYLALVDCRRSITGGSLQPMIFPAEWKMCCSVWMSCLLHYSRDRSPHIIYQS